MTAGQFFYGSSAVQTALSSSLTSGATSVAVSSITGYPTQYPFTLLLEWGTANQEVVTVTQAATGGGPYTFANCLRGQDGTTGVSHSSAAQVNHGVSARDFFQIPSVINVCAYGADPTGTADSTTAINNAIAAIPAGGGSVYLPAGSYKISGTLLFAQNQGMTGAGSTCTYLNYTANSVCVQANVSGTFTGAQFGGKFEGFYLNGYSGGSSAIGMQVGNLQGTIGRDIQIYGFTSIGLYFKSTSGDWTEESVFTAIRCVQNGTAVVFDTSSFDYGVYEFLIVTGAGQGGVTLQNAAQLQGCRLAIRGNFYAHASSNTAAVIAIDPAGGSATSYITNTEVDCAVESAGTGIGHYTVLMNSTNSASQFTGTGTLSFNPTAVAFQGYSNPHFVPFSFAGVIKDPVIGSLTAGADALYSYGQIITNDITVNGNGNYASGNPCVFLTDGTQTWQFFDDKNTHNWGVYDQTHSATGLQLTPSTLNLQVVTGNVDIQTAGKGLQVAEGSNAKQGTLTLNGVTAVVVSNTSVTANSRIFLTIQVPGGGTTGAPYVSARSAGTSFSVKSTGAGDTSTCAYFITEPG